MDTPHSEQLILASCCPGTFGRFPLHLLHRLGSCWNCFSRKKTCSPTLKMNSSPHFTHFNIRSEKSMSPGMDFCSCCFGPPSAGSAFCGCSITFFQFLCVSVSECRNAALSSCAHSRFHYERSRSAPHHCVVLQFHGCVLIEMESLPRDIVPPYWSDSRSGPLHDQNLHGLRRRNQAD